MEEKQSKRPNGGRFQQQQLVSWDPVMTPGTVIPTLFLIGILFCPVGGILWWNSNKVDEIMINYSYCLQYQKPVYMIPKLYKYNLSKDYDRITLEPPAYSYQNHSSFLDPSWKNPNQLEIPRCTIDFTVPYTISGPLLLYYRLTNFYQNRRQYIKSYNDLQLSGKIVTDVSSCDPLGRTEDGKIIYPCGLIANSMFNDTISDLISVDEKEKINWSKSRLAWPSDKQKYGATKFNLSSIVPPPNWATRYPQGQYTVEYPPPDLSDSEGFMVWMHVSALSDFRKIWARSSEDLKQNRWRISIDMNFDTTQYNGEKWLVLSSTTGLGGRGPYLGIAYMVVGGICIVLGILLLLRHWIRPRKLGDKSYLSWNQPGGGLPLPEKKKN